MKKWEYCVKLFTHVGDYYHHILKELGEEGWELVSVFVTQADIGDKATRETNCATFKREVPDQTQDAWAKELEARRKVYCEIQANKSLSPEEKLHWGFEASMGQIDHAPTPEEIAKDRRRTEPEPPEPLAVRFRGASPIFQQPPLDDPDVD